MSYENETVDLTLTILHETPSAVFVSDGDNECWLAKSQINILDDYEVGDDVEIVVPEWMALANDLI